MQTTRDALGMSVAERKRRRIAQPAFWSRQAENTLDRATAMMPRLLYERLDEFGADFAIIYPTAGLRVPRINDDDTQAGGRSRPQHRHRRLLPRSGRPDDPGRDHSHAHAGRGDRRARVRDEGAGGEGGHVRQRHVAARRCGLGDRPRCGAPRRLVRRAGPRQRLRLRSGLGEVPGARDRADLPQRGQQPGPAAVADQLRLQPHRSFRRRRPRGLQGHLPGRRDPALPGAAVRLPRRRRGLGLPDVRRPDRALGASQCAKRWSAWIPESSIVPCS